MGRRKKRKGLSTTTRTLTGRKFEVIEVLGEAEMLSILEIAAKINTGHFLFDTRGKAVNLKYLLNQFGIFYKEGKYIQKMKYVMKLLHEGYVGPAECRRLVQYVFDDMYCTKP